MSRLVRELPFVAAIGFGLCGWSNSSEGMEKTAAPTVLETSAEETVLFIFTGVDGSTNSSVLGEPARVETLSKKPLSVEIKSTTTSALMKMSVDQIGNCKFVLAFEGPKKRNGAFQIDFSKSYLPDSLTDGKIELVFAEDAVCDPKDPNVCFGQKLGDVAREHKNKDRLIRAIRYFKTNYCSGRPF